MINWKTLSQTFIFELGETPIAPLIQVRKRGAMGVSPNLNTNATDLLYLNTNFITNYYI
jgi:hypothetical protein